MESLKLLLELVNAAPGIFDQVSNLILKEQDIAFQLLEDCVDLALVSAPHRKSCFFERTQLAMQFQAVSL